MIRRLLLATTPIILIERKGAKMDRRIIMACGVAVALLFGIGSAPAHAQSNTCFAETGHCISGRFAQYWAQNGGLAVFG